MSHYYGTLQGNRGEATRQGTKKSGIATNTACWTGTIQTRLWYDDDTDTDHVMIEVRGWPYGEYAGTIYNGTIQDLRQAVKDGTLVRASTQGNAKPTTN